MTGSKSTIPPEDPDLISVNQAMGIFNYRDREAFHQFVRRSNIPRYRLNARKILFDRSELRSWLDARRIGPVQRIQPLM